MYLCCKKQIIVNKYIVHLLDKRNKILQNVRYKNQDLFRKMCLSVTFPFCYIFLSSSPVGFILLRIV